MTSRQGVLIRRPEGRLRHGDIGLVEVPVPDPGPGQLVVRNTWMSLDPSMRVRMSGGSDDYLPPFAIGEPLAGWAVGTVVASRSAAFAEGDLVMHGSGWREHALLDEAGPGPVTLRPERVPDDVPARWYLGPLGWVGLTSWVGLHDVAALTDGDRVFVSGAAGAVGGLAVQIAALLGHEVIGSAGTAEKVRHVRALGASVAFCYRDGPVATLLAAVAPDGIDVYFDNVGGDHLEAALDLLRPGGRVALCGAIAGYDEPVPGPTNLFNAVARGLTLRGFMARMYPHRLGEFRERMREWLATGSIVYPETVHHGLDAAPAAFADLLGGGNVGKVLVEL
ncbi:NADP-dependent oxidoreductase [Pseudonocardia kujensis]|uniref:NADP-dependent oxidoreductase n=1 Tax=Pseudonocardia kujensis TaxID=1128675 RepID=UPI001E56C8BD|nr:NADP-dependent oxidoreductase [Pseudonocardia kujensis]MCE0761988.1 NADP-dependent oxidoreductase [Pseudonocardia kujensis]